MKNNIIPELSNICGLRTYSTLNFTKYVRLSLDVSKSTDRMANSVDPDQTARIGAV